MNLINNELSRHEYRQQTWKSFNDAEETVERILYRQT
jgi:hypothetical protein